MATISELFKKYVVPTTTKAPITPKIATDATAGASVGSVAPVVPTAISGSTAGFDMSNYKADITEAGVPKATLPSLINVNTAKQMNTLQKTATGAGVQAITQMQPQNALQYNPNQTAGLNVIQQAQPKQTAPQPAPVQTAQPVNVQIPSTLSSEDISSTTTQFKGSQGISTSTADQFMASLNPSLTSLSQTTQQAEQLANQMTAGGISQLQDEQTKLRQEISKLSGDMSQSARKAELEQQYGLNEQLTQLSELNKQIASKSAQYQQAIIENQGRNVLTSQIAGREGQLKRQMAVEIGGLTAMAEAMQGNIDMARSIIKDTVALEYEDKQNQLNTLLQQLEWNREDMTKEEQKQAAKMEADAKAQQAQLEIAQKNREQIMEIAAQAAGKGADFNTLQQMLTAESPEDALLMSGGYLATPSELEMYQAKKEIDAMYDAGKMTELEMYEAKKAIDEGFARQKTQAVDTAQAQAAATDANNKLQTIDAILGVFEGGGSSSVVGTGFGIGPGFKNLWETEVTGESGMLLANVEKLISQQTLQTLIDLKKSGGTLGAVSQTELDILINAATNLGSNNIAMRDSNGTIVGFKIPESQFVAEIKRMKDAVVSIKDKALLLTAPNIDQYYMQGSDAVKQKIDTMFQSGLYANPDEVWEAIQASIGRFNKVGGDTKQASIQSKIASAIPGGTQYTKPTDGECGYWSRKIVDYPSGTGDTLAEKTAFVKREGLQRDAWLKAGPKVGDVIFTNDSKDYGHVAVVNSINPDGSITVSESNYKGHYLVSHDRKIPLNSNSIIGAVRGKLKTNISNIA
jgi:hypothetical protein